MNMPRHRVVVIPVARLTKSGIERARLGDISSLHNCISQYKETLSLTDIALIINRNVEVRTYA
jgi:hypothetical protein